MRRTPRSTYVCMLYPLKNFIGYLVIYCCIVREDSWCSSSKLYTIRHIYLYSHHGVRSARPGEAHRPGIETADRGGRRLLRWSNTRHGGRCGVFIGWKYFISYLQYSKARRSEAVPTCCNVVILPMVTKDLPISPRFSPTIFYRNACSAFLPLVN